MLMRRQQSASAGRSGDAAPVPKCLYHQGVEAKLRECFAGAGIVLGAPGQAIAAQPVGQGALLTALPDRLSGHRLAGRAQDNARAREALSELGLNPLMVEAFRDRSTAV